MRDWVQLSELEARARGFRYEAWSDVDKQTFWSTNPTERDWQTVADEFVSYFGLASIAFLIVTVKDDKTDEECTFYYD